MTTTSLEDVFVSCPILSGLGSQLLFVTTLYKSSGAHREPEGTISLNFSQALGTLKSGISPAVSEQLQSLAKHSSPSLPLPAYTTGPESCSICFPGHKTKDSFSLTKGEGALSLCTEHLGVGSHQNEN